MPPTNRFFAPFSSARSLFRHRLHMKHKSMKHITRTSHVITFSLLCSWMPIFIHTAGAEPSNIRVLREIKVDGATGFYEQNRPPLQPVPFLKLPVANIVPGGWLRRQLELDANGISGRMQEISDFCQFDQTGWVHPEKEGWEEVTYWLRGYGSLAYVLNDPKLIEDTRKWITAVMATQDADGYFGPAKFKPKAEAKVFPDPWGHMPMLHALRSYYEHTNDEKALKCLVGYFKFLDTLPTSFFKSGWAGMRWADTLDTTYWLYNIKGEEWLLGLSTKIQQNSLNWVGKLHGTHNVNFAQGIRQPAEYWQQTKDPALLEMTEQHYQKMMTEFGQFPGGGFASDEVTRSGFVDPRQGFETCGFVEFMGTFEIMSKISGNPIWADRNEEIAFNSLPAALTPDHKGIHYITPANVIQLDRFTKKYRQFNNRWPLLPFKPGIHQYRCCPHNYGMAWPNYAAELWLATYDKGICAMLYAASEVKAKVGDGTEVKISENTEYPFAENVELKLSTPKAVKFPLYLRVPRWCNNATLAINGKSVSVRAEPLSYVIIERLWADGDRVTWTMPMHPSVRTWAANKNSVSVDYGPLSFALDMGEKWEKDNAEKRDQGTDAWPQWKVTAAKPWNYGLAIDLQKPEIEVVRKPGPLASNPFTPETAPIELRVKAKKIPQWQADEENVITELQPSPVKSTEPVETVRLIPMGAARLRITAFPKIGDGSDANQWKQPPPPVMQNLKVTASHCSVGDKLETVFDGVMPVSSADSKRITWLDHKGTAEWLQCEFPEPREISSAMVYWFDDTDRGSCRVPQSWRLLYRTNGEWKPVESGSLFSKNKDCFNEARFKPVQADALRIEVQLQKDYSGGMIQCKVE